jgi:16S rRNA (guanine(527)-N(7))-methyltransferase RsmG
MKQEKLRTRPADKVWAEFVDHVKPTDEQLEQFEKYAAYLLECNKQFNLTAIPDLSGVVRQHFEDSLMLTKFHDFSTVTTLCDIGTGAGFPGIPLKIMNPHIKVVLIEVSQKKQDFLREIIKLLNLENVEICAVDWRTFLRTTSLTIDFFVTRAALDSLELARMFKPGTAYNKGTLVYWASRDWECHPKAAALVKRDEMYKLAHKERRLIFMSL